MGTCTRQQTSRHRPRTIKSPKCEGLGSTSCEIFGGLDWLRCTTFMHTGSLAALNAGTAPPISRPFHATSTQPELMCELSANDTMSGSAASLSSGNTQRETSAW